MARITAISRCSGGNHVHLTVELSGGRTIQRTYLMDDLTEPPPLDEEKYQIERLKLMVREAQAAGNTTYVQIRTYLLNREFVE